MQFLGRAVALTSIVLASGLMAAEPVDHEARIKRLETIVLQLQSALEHKEQQIVDLQRQLTNKQTAPDRLAGTSVNSNSGDARSLLDRMVRDLSAAGGKVPVPEKAESRLMDISAIIDIAVGGSDSRNEEIGDTLQTGGHDPKERGFNFQQLELSVSGAVDPYFNAEAHIVFSEEAVEVEEAFLTTLSLPAGLQLKTGYFLTEFGRINPTHLHSWDWIDQPIINSRLFGGEGTRGAGARLSWLTPLPWHSALSLGVQNSGGEFAPSFRGEPGGHHHGEEEAADEELPEEYGEEGVGGRPFFDSDTRSFDDLMYSMRWANGMDLSDTLSAQIGVSGMWGRNGNSKNSHTWIYGADLVLKSSDPGAGLRRPRWVWQTEIMKRDYDADAFVFFDDMGDADPSNDIDINLPSDTLEDWGLYSQFLYSVNTDWSVGLRYEWAGGSGDSAEEGELYDRDMDSGRGDRIRVSPMVLYQPTEFSRIRMQYNYDDADFISGGEAHSVWLGFEVLLGSHPAHGY